MNTSLEFLCHVGSVPRPKLYAQMQVLVLGAGGIKVTSTGGNGETKVWRKEEFGPFEHIFLVNWNLKTCKDVKLSNNYTLLKCIS